MTAVPTFRVTVGIESPSQRGHVQEVRGVLVDTGADATWVPRHVLEALGVQPERKERYRTATGETVEREVGFAIVHAAGRTCVDHVVFGEPNDALILGERSLDGLNVKVDTKEMRLVDAGPIIVAAA